MPAETPIPDVAASLDAIRTRQDFARELTMLRVQAGLTVRDVAKALRIPDSTIGGYFGGAHLPPVKPPGLLNGILQVCGVTDAKAVEAWTETLIRLRRVPGRRPSDAPVPYRGLESFQPEDALWFYGRETLTATLVKRLAQTHDTGGTVVVVGPSGSGKSSLLRAGVVPAIRSGGLGVDGSDSWPVLLFSPGSHPLSELASQLAKVSEDSPAVTVDDLAVHGRWWEHLTLAATQSGPPEGVPTDGQVASIPAGMVIIVDQFEEVFAACDDPAQRHAFVSALCAATRPVAAAQESDGPKPPAVLVVIGLRADFYQHALQHPLLVAALQANHVVVGPMSVEEVRRTITEPAHRAKIDLEEGLVELLLRDLTPAPDGTSSTAGHEPGALPLLSHALLSTWERGSRGRLTVAAYRDSGGIQGAVAHTAEEIYRELTGAQKDIARQLFVRLVHIADGTADTRQRVAPSDLPLESDDARAVLDKFIERRLITVDRDRVEITHEALLPAWPRLRGWIDGDRAGLRIHRQLAVAAEAWRDSGEEDNALYRGGRLATATEWAEDSSHRADLNKLESRFLDASTEYDLAQQRIDRRRTRRLRRLLAAVTVLLLATGASAVYAFKQRAAADEQRDLAVSRQVATVADQLRHNDVALAMQLALAAYQVHPTPEARSSLLASYAGPSATRAFAAPGVMQAVATNSSANLMAGGGADHTIHLWSIARQGRPVALSPPLAGHSDTVFAVAFSPDGHTLASGSGDKTVRLWDLSRPDQPQQLGDAITGPTNTVYSVTFSPDGRTLAAGSADNAVHLWNVEDRAHPTPLSVLAGSVKFVQSVAFSPDGRTLAAGSADQTVRLWNVSDPRRAVSLGRPLTGPAKTVFSVAFSPDGRKLAAGSADDSVWMWDVTDPSKPSTMGEPLKGPESWINSVAFSPDGRALAAASSDSKVWTWDLATRSVTATLPHPGPVTSVSYQDGGTLVTSGADGVARIWRSPGPLLSGYTKGIFTAAFSAQHHVLAVTSADNTGRLFDITDPRRPAPLSPPLHDLTVSGRASGAGALSPDGNTLVIGTVDGSAQIWDVTDKGHPVAVADRLAGHSAMIEAMTFSPDGRLLVIGSDDRTATVWNLTDPHTPTRLAAQITATNYIYSPALSLDGRTLAVGDADNTIGLWDVTNPDHAVQLGSPLTGPTSYVFSVQFSPDGKTLAAGSADDLVWRWDVTDVRHPLPIGQPLAGPTNYVYSVAFSADGSTLAAGGGDGSVWLWNIADRDSPELLATLAAHAGPVFTLAFDPTRDLLVTGGADRTARLWDTDVDSVAAYVCSTSGDGITRQEWSKYLPGLPYNPPC